MVLVIGTNEIKRFGRVLASSQKYQIYHLVNPPPPPPRDMENVGNGAGKIRRASPYITYVRKRTLQVDASLHPKS